MPMLPSEIIQLIQESLPDAKIDLRDMRGDQDHYEMTVFSSAFEGKTRIQQHQLVYKALKGAVGKQLHALSLITSAPSH